MTEPHQQDDDDEEARRERLAAASDAPLLLAALGDDSWRVRKEATQRLATWRRPEEVVAPLVALLHEDADVGARNAAVEALAALGAPAVASLLGALAGPPVAGPARRKFIIDTLGALGDSAAVPALARALGDTDENVGAAAAEALAKLGGPDAERALVAALGKTGLYLRLATLEGLAALGAELPLAVALPHLGTPTHRHAALLLLGKSGDLEALPYLLAALTDRVALVRTSASLSLVELHAHPRQVGARERLEASVGAAPPAAVTSLIAALDDAAADVRRAATTLLGWGRWPEALAPLAELLVDEEVAEAAARALVAFGPAAIAPLVAVARSAAQPLRGEIFRLFPRFGAAAADARVAALLEQALADEDALTAAAAARALGELGGKDALGPLFHTLDRSGDPAVAQAVGQALGKLGLRFRDEVRMLVGARGLEGKPGAQLCRVIGAVGRPADRQLLLGALGSTDAQLRQAAAAALGKLGAAFDIVEALIFALVDEDARVRAAAADSLGILADASSVAALTAACRDDDADVVAAAARALGHVADPRSATILVELVRGSVGPVAAAALESLGRLPGEPDLTLFAQALERGDAELAKSAVRALQHKAGAEPVLLLALEHARWDVRRRAAQVLSARSAQPTVAAALKRRISVETDALVTDAIADAVKGPTG